MVMMVVLIVMTVVVVMIVMMLMVVVTVTLMATVCFACCFSGVVALSNAFRDSFARRIPSQGDLDRDRDSQSLSWALNPVAIDGQAPTTPQRMTETF